MNYPQELIRPYNNNTSKTTEVEQMFDNIAPAYDRLNHILSLDIDKKWRRKAIDWLKPYCPASILDVATGTGDFAIQAYQALKPAELIGSDISEGMMNVARQKVKTLGLGGHISFRREDCTALSFSDNRFDAVTVAFGVRNFENLDQGLREIRRVLRPGGHLVILELSEPNYFPFKQGYRIYSKVIIPSIGKLLSNDRKAYSYLPKSIKAFPEGKVMKQIMLNAGFSKVEFQRLTLGTCTLYFATK